MNDPAASDDIERLADRAAAARDMGSACRLLERVVAARPGHIDAWLKLAGARRAVGDSDGAIDAATRALFAEPLHVMALLTRGRLLEAAGRRRQAARDYTHALAQLPDDPAAVPGPLRPLLDHARRCSRDREIELAAVLDGAVAGEPMPDAETARRIDRFKSNVLRRTRTYHSEPSHFHYPGLVEREFHDRRDFPWLAALEARTEAIRTELDALVADGTAVAEPYVRYPSDQPVRQWATLNNSTDWTALHLWKAGTLVAGNAARCPHTLAALAPLPQPRLAARSPNAMFSLLKPRTRIPPHTGVANTRLVCHLPLVVPPGCWFRVGAERREWKVGEAFVFDDTIEHEAANDSDLPRVVLIFDIWHPGLDADERAAIARLMDAHQDAEGGAP